MCSPAGILLQMGNAASILAGEIIFLRFLEYAGQANRHNIHWSLKKKSILNNPV